MEAAVGVAGWGVAVETGAGADVVAGTGTTVATETGRVEAEVGGVLVAVVVGWGATEVPVWAKAPPGTDEGVGIGPALVTVVGAAEAALEPAAEPEEPDEKGLLLVRLPTVPDWQELGPEAQPMRRLATSEA